MKNFLKTFPLILFCLTISYQTIAQNTSPHFNPIENNYYRNIIQPTTVSDSTKVYSQPDTNSVVLQVFKFKTHLRLLGEWDDTKEINTEKVKENVEKYTFTHFTNLGWYKIELNYGNGYVK